VTTHGGRLSGAWWGFDAEFAFNNNFSQIFTGEEILISFRFSLCSAFLLPPSSCLGTEAADPVPLSTRVVAEYNPSSHLSISYHDPAC